MGFISHSTVINFNKQFVISVIAFLSPPSPTLPSSISFFSLSFLSFYSTHISSSDFYLQLYQFNFFYINVLLHLFMNTLFLYLLFGSWWQSLRQNSLIWQLSGPFEFWLFYHTFFFLFLSNLIRFYFTNIQSLYLTGFGSLMKFPSHMHWNRKLISMLFREVRTKCPNRSINWF